jgi:alginate O-acetyltransferase complex protein AlgJ
MPSSPVRRATTRLPTAADASQISSATGADRATTTVPGGASARATPNAQTVSDKTIAVTRNGAEGPRDMKPSIDCLLPKEGLSKTLPRNAFLRALAATAAVSMARPAAAANLIIEGKGDWLFPAWESLTDAGTAGIASATKTIATTNQLFKAAGIALLVEVVPMKARFYPDRLPDGTTMTPAVGARYGAILAGLTAAGVPTFDVNAVLQTVTQQIFFRTDYHWTEWSAEAVAQACAKQLQSMVTLPPSPAPLPPLSAFATEQHAGDLEALLPPDRQKSIGTEPISTRVIDATRTQLLDPAKSDVHVVGNSLSMPYLGFPEMLAETLREPVGITAKFGNAGPWETMVQYVESPEFVARHPRAIVWQFVEGLFMHGPDATGFWDVTSLMSDQTFLARVTKVVRPA